MESSLRDKTLESLDRFYRVLGFYPRSYACHANNKENLYWGEERFTFGIFKRLYRLLSPKESNYFCGNKEGSPYYWGDICQEYIDYVRTFTYYCINLSDISLKLPYSTRRQPYFKSCFFTADAGNVEEFNQLLCFENQERLEKEAGICIITTHFGKGCVKAGEIHPVTRRLLLDLSRRNGWFAPVSTVLDFLRTRENSANISQTELFRLELKYFSDAIKRKLKNRGYEKTELMYLKRNER